MTTQELHIQIDLLLQKVSSHWNSNFLPQEKDYFINREITKFVKQRLSPLSNQKRLSVFDTIKRTEDLNSLIKTIPLDVVTLNQREVEIQLPFDFLYYISSEIYSTPICTDAKPFVQVAKTKYLKTFKPVNIINTLTGVSISITQGAETKEVFNLTTLPSGYIPIDAIPDYKKVFIINNAIFLSLGTLSSLFPNIEGQFNTTTGLFEFRSSEPFTISYLLNANTQSIVSNTTLYLGYNEASTLDSRVRIVDEEFKTDIKTSYLSKSKDESLVAYLKERSIVLPKTAGVVMNGASFTYFCKPNKVDVFLNSNSTLPNHVLDEIIGNVVEQIKGVISSDTYEKYTQENLLIE